MWRLILFLGLLPSASEAQQDSVDARLVAALKTYIPEIMRLDNTPGLNIAVARHGRVIWEEGFGFADLAAKTPMTARTVMHSGSMGKTYTATAVMQLVEQGVIGLHEPVNRYLKTFQIHNPLGDREITPFDLLTHRSGLTSDAAGSEFALPPPLGEYLAREYGKPMFESYDRSVVPRWSAKVGEKYQYSNFGIATLGYLVEAANPEHLSFSDYVTRHIIEPLGMTSTQFPPVQDAAHVRPDIWSRMSTGYSRMGAVHVPTPAIYFASFPAGTVVTTPGDHVKLLLAYQNHGSYNGHQLLKPETVDLMLSPRVGRNESTGVGLVWMLNDFEHPGWSFGHGGAHMFGWRNEFRAYPEADLAVAVATNHWDLASPSYGLESVRVAEFAGEWLKHELAHPHPARPATTWGWKVSYVMGLLMVDQMMGSLGIASPLTPAMIDAMARGAQVNLAAQNGEAVWDQAGFRAGIEDLLPVKKTPQAIREFMASDRMPVTPEELPLIYRALGGVPALIPNPEFAPPPLR
jgi:CubicO group peptidase (beta-lactamase class C family)